MHILVTGGAGFIGIRLVRKLLADGHNVSILDNFSPQIHGANDRLPTDLEDSVELIRGDVRDESVWISALPGHEVVINLAAETGTGQSMYQVRKYAEVNLLGTAVLYDLLAKNPNNRVERVIVASSRAVYGEGAYSCSEDGTVYPLPRSTTDKKLGLFDPICPICEGPCISIPTPETAPFQPFSFYGLTKQVQEQTTLLFGEVLGIPSFALRYQNVYGPGQSLKNPYTGILAIFANLARSGGDINVFEDGEESRDFVYIDDVVNATTASVTCPPNRSSSINIGSQERIRIIQVAEAVNEYFGGRSKVKVNGAFRQGDIRHGFADLRRAKSLLNYEPQTCFTAGLRKFLGWVEENQPELTGYEHSLHEMREKGFLHERGNSTAATFGSKTE